MNPEQHNPAEVAASFLRELILKSGKQPVRLPEELAVGTQIDALPALFKAKVKAEDIVLYSVQLGRLVFEGKLKNRHTLWHTAKGERKLPVELEIDSAGVVVADMAGYLD